MEGVTSKANVGDQLEEYREVNSNNIEDVQVKAKKEVELIVEHL